MPVSTPKPLPASYVCLLPCRDWASAYQTTAAEPEGYWLEIEGRLPPDLCGTYFRQAGSDAHRLASQNQGSDVRHGPYVQPWGTPEPFSTACDFKGDLTGCLCPVLAALDTPSPEKVLCG